MVTVLQNNDDMADAMSIFMGRPEIRNKPLNFSQVDVDFRGNAFFPGYPMSNFPNFDNTEAPQQFQPSAFPHETAMHEICLLYTSPSPRDLSTSRMPSSA